MIRPLNAEELRTLQLLRYCCWAPANDVLDEVTLRALLNAYTRKDWDRVDEISELIQVRAKVR